MLQRGRWRQPGGSLRIELPLWYPDDRNELYLPNSRVLLLQVMAAFLVGQTCPIQGLSNSLRRLVC